MGKVDVPVNVVLVTPDTAMGEALAVACADHALALTVVHPSASEHDVDSAVVVLDLLADDAAITPEVSTLVDGETNRVLVLAEGPVRDIPGLHVDGWITADVSVEAFVAAVADTRVASRGLRVAEATATTHTLTARERAVLAQILAGHGNEPIAAHLDISEHTVRTHLQNILAKLGVKSRSEAASWALRAGVVAADPTQEAAS